MFSCGLYRDLTFQLPLSQTKKAEGLNPSAASFLRGLAFAFAPAFLRGQNSAEGCVPSAASFLRGLAFALAPAFLRGQNSAEGCGGLKWTRTTDLTLIRRAL